MTNDLMSVPGQNKVADADYKYLTDHIVGSCWCEYDL